MEKPTVIQFPVIDICNSRCQMCKIWENKSSQDITLDQLTAGLRSGLFSEVTSIGFNGGEPTLRKDLPELVQVAINCLPKLRNVSLITNAYKYRDVNDQVDRIGAITRKAGIKLDLMVSLDGYQQVHDRVRGKPGNFERAKQVIAHAKASPLVDSLRIGCTVIRDNVFELPDLLDFCIDQSLYVKFRQGVPHQRLYTENLSEPYALSAAERYEFIEFLEGLIAYYETGYLQRHFYRSLINQIVHNSPRNAGCDWQHRGATITASGELAYCAVKSKALMPDIGKGDPESVYFDNESHLRDIIQNDCDSCHHDYVGIPGRSDTLKWLLSLLDQKYRIKHLALGLPGFHYLLELRSKRRFHREIVNCRQHPENIRLKAAGAAESQTRVMICGWYGTETLGDKAILGGVVQALEAAYGHSIDITVVSLNPYVTEITRSQMMELEDVTVCSLDEALTSVSNHDLLIFGGGPLMAINEIGAMQVLFERAKKAGLGTIAAAVGVGPMGPAWINDSIRTVLTLCDKRIYRDNDSQQKAQSLGIDTTEDMVAEDPAFSWLRAQKTDRRTEELPSNRKVLLLGLREFPYRQYGRSLSSSAGNQLSEEYESAVVQALEKLVESDPSWVIKPLPMCTNHFGEDDRWFYRRLFRGNRKLHPFLDYGLLGRELAPQDYLSSFQTADVLLGMRFHSLVFGAELDTPAVAIDYTLGKGKVKALAESYKIPCLSMFGLSSDQIVDKVVDRYESRVGLKKLPPHAELKFPDMFKSAIPDGSRN